MLVLIRGTPLDLHCLLSAHSAHAQCYALYQMKMTYLVEMDRAMEAGEEVSVLSHLLLSSSCSSDSLCHAADLIVGGGGGGGGGGGKHILRFD